MKSVDADKIYPGKTGNIEMIVENIFDDDAEDVSVSLNLANTGFITEGVSEKSVESIETDEDENFRFTLKTSVNTKPGDYNLPYTINYFVEGENGTRIQIAKSGTFGVTVVAKTELEYTTELENNVQEERGTLSIKITNKGLGDVGFVSVKIISQNGLEIIGKNEEYIGAIRSDDSETAEFVVLYNEENAKITTEISYKDSENNEKKETIPLPIKVYTKEKALELGIIKKNYNWVYGVVVLILIIGWVVYKKIKKAKKKNGLK